jgi:glyoxylate/hydroxypyruvate reductase A
MAQGALMFLSLVDRDDMWTAHFRRLKPSLEVRVFPKVEPVEDVSYALVWKPPAGELLRYPHLRCVFSLGAGVDHLLSDPAFPKHVPLVRVVDPSLTRGMSEYVVLQVLMHHRRQPEFLQFQRLKKWQLLMSPDAGDVRVGIMGLGVLGSDAAEKLRPFGYQLAGWSHTRKSIAGVESFAGMDELKPFLQRTDILVCLLPLTPETRGILNRETFAQLPAGAVVINAARGGHLVEHDLIAALDSGHLKGATLDVFQTEPLPESSPLWAHPKVIVTPHLASFTDPRFVSENVVANIERIERGEAPHDTVDLSRGY